MHSILHQAALEAKTERDQQMAFGSSGNGGLLPGLPHDLGLLCLARLPCRLYPLARGVSRAWSQALESPSSSSATDIYALRRRIGAQETWLLSWVRSFSHEFQWFLLDPSSSSPLPIPRPPCTPSSEGIDYRVLSAHGGRILLAARRGGTCNTNASKHWMCFDALRRQWSCITSPPSLLSERTFCGAYSLPLSDGYVYAAGGGHLSEDGKLRLRGDLSLKSAERLNVGHESIGSWEKMPDMHRERTWPAGAVLNDRFYVIGGFGGTDPVFGLSVMEHSGEIWDPTLKEWKLVPELCPEEIFGKYDTPSVTVVQDCLFALRRISQEVMMYDDIAKSWTSMGSLPLPWDPDVNYSLYGVGRELWIIRKKWENVGLETPILTCVPCGRRKPLIWRLSSFQPFYWYYMKGVPITI